MRNAIWISGRDVGADFGLHVENVKGLFGDLSVGLSREALIGRAGVLRNTGNIPINEKVLTFQNCVFKGSSPADLRLKVSEFFRWVRAGELQEIELSMFPNRVFYGSFQSASDTFDSAAAQFITRYSGKGDLLFLLHSPLMYDKNIQTYNGAPNKLVMPIIGNFACAPEIRIWNVSTVANPSLSLYRANGSLIKTVQFTITLGNDDYVYQVNDELAVYKVLNGVITEDANIAPTGDPFFILDPADGDPINNLFPYLIGTNCSIEVTLRRIWTVSP